MRGEPKVLAKGNGNVEQKKAIGEQLWLHYYNQTLFEAGLITEQEKNRMTNRINGRIASALGRK